MRLPFAHRNRGWFETLERRELLTSSATVTFETTDTSGNVISAIPVGGTFQLRAIVQDTSGRGANSGIYEAYVDGSYNPTLASIPSDATASVVSFGPLFVNGPNENTQTAGALIDTGAFNEGVGSLLKPPGSAPQLLFSIPVTATAAGTETFTPSFIAGNQWQIAVFGDDSALTAGQVTFVPSSINITGDQPTIAVSGNSQPIADGSTTPSAAQGTDFGLRQVAGSPLVETYTIANNGTTPLTVGQVSLSGANAGDFSLLTQPAGTVSAGSSTTFSVQFVAGAVAARTATLSFSQNDPGQSTPFTFAIGGEGTTAQLVVTGLGQVIADGALTTTATDGTDFGTAPPGNSPVVESFTLINTGNSSINLASITIGGASANDFTVGSPPASPLAPGLAETFTLTFAPVAGPAGQRLATVSINDDDSTQPNPFTFAISGVAQAPVIAVSGNGSPIDAGDTTTSLLNGTQFGAAFTGGGGGVGQTYTITNGGLVPLTVGTVTLTADSGGDFTVSKQPAQSIAPSGSTTFTISFQPSALGARSAVVSFAQSDPAQLSPFTFAVSGTGVAFAPSDLASVTFEATDSSGDVLASAPVGTSFQLRAIVQDTSGRGANGGVFETYVDGSYDPTLVSIPSDANAPVVTFAPSFLNGPNENTQTAGSLVDTGAVAGTEGTVPKPTGSAPQLLFSLPVTATAAGNATFTPSFIAGSDLWQIALFGDDSALTASQVTFVPASIDITGGSPAIAVSAGGQPIADGSSTTSVGNDTDFGSALVGGAAVTQTFTIANQGTAPLNVGSVSLSGTGSADFTVTGQPASSVAPGGSTTFTIQFQPTAGGARTASVSFNENDTTQANPFSFAIDGVGLLAPRIAVAGDNLPIADGSATPSALNDTDFGSALLGGNPIFETFTIANHGTAALNVGSVSLSGTGSADFTVTNQPASSVAPGSSTTFAVHFQPTAGGVRTASVSFNDNDTTQANPFNFTIDGTGLLAPTIAVAGDGQTIADGSTTTNILTGTDFGSALLGGSPVTETFTIANQGTGPLTVGNVSFGGASPNDFIVTSQPAAAVAPGTNTTFTVQFQSTVLGTRLATVSFGDNDPNQPNPFTFAIRGDALPGLSITGTQVTLPDDETKTVNAVFTVNLSVSSPQTVTVNFATVDGTAVAGTDYQASSGTLTFLPGTTNQTITVAVNGTLYANPTKQFSVALSQPGGALVTGSTATGSLVNNNVPTWTNPINSDDVNADGAVTPIDALVIINDLDSNGLGVDPTPPDGKHAFLDTNKDGAVTPLDALVVINEINTAVRAGAAIQAVSQSTAPASLANSAATTAVSVTSAPSSQLVDLAFAVYNGEDLAIAASTLPGSLGKSGPGRRPNQ